ncbi:COP9 signalosome complex subunit 1 isoform X2 [Hyalella azteca]|uniref:COP9 signalosome complex subunit 1 isoform X1 n=1 Tax=Hyalella azteca TaxID=294128 RepID=A0A8B7NEW9_HYAAZ|nr:COP9 signalosome complex subunit 1 isoform X1 [Hyalella azteca]XP_018012150.1 COP9 signalosome complex subunit 1 isoform X2 [Hyalella azteca]
MQLQNHLEPMVVDPVNEENDNQEEEAVIVENSNLDLDLFSSNYGGLGRLYRLIFIADRCPGLREEALLMALAHVQTTCNVALYNKIIQKLHQPGLSSGSGGSGNLPDVAAGGGEAGASGGVSSARSTQSIPGPDLQWIEAKTKKASMKLEKLDADLKSSKVNSIKESIRRGHDELGDHYLDCGELSNALKCYSRARDYCTSHVHILTMCLNVIKVSIYLQNWSHVLSYVSKAQATTESTDAKSVMGSNKDQSAIIQTKLACAAGLAHLATKKYNLAAKSFLAAQLDSCVYNEILSPWNVAVYGGLCALATFTRQELHQRVIMSSSFKQFLELEPQLRDLIFKFYQSKYAQCLKLLDELKDTLMLDMYLASHVKTLYSKIRNRGLIQYFRPFKSASLERMAGAFNTTVSGLEDELMALILEGLIQARIDSHNKIVYAACVEERSVTFERTLEMGQQHIDRLHMLLLRAALIRQQMHVKPPSRDAMPGSSGSAADTLSELQGS